MSTFLHSCILTCRDETAITLSSTLVICAAPATWPATMSDFLMFFSVRAAKGAPWLVGTDMSTMHPVRFVSEPDDGQYHAINKGFARASGDVYAYINSDDYLYPGSLQCVADAWNGVRELGLRHCARLLAHSLPVNQVAGVLVGDPGLDGARGLGQPHLEEELGEVAHPPAEVGIEVLQMRPAARRVDHQVVEVLHPARAGVDVAQPVRLFEVAVVLSLIPI